MPEKKKIGLWNRFKRKFQSPEQQARHELIMKLAASDTYYSTILQGVNREGRYGTYDEDLRRKLIQRLSQEWLNKHGRSVFPTIDEFEIEEGWTVLSSDHAQRERHQKFTLHQLGAWIDTQKHNLGMRR